MARNVQKPPAPSLVHMTATAGHHEAYLDLFGRLFGLAPSVGKIGPRLFVRLCGARRLFFGTLDDDVAGFIAVAFGRAMLGRKTGGLFLHPNSCVEPGLRATIKRTLFSMLRRIPGVSIVSILPFGLMPGLERVATHSVHDPQFWDQMDDPPAVDEEALRTITEAAAGRPILAYLGWATEFKGFPFLANIVSMPDFSGEIFVIAAGRVNANCQVAARRFTAAGATLWDRFVSDGELAAIYRAADIVWVCYAPGYDQASGIFGRAVQYGRRVAIRDTARTIGRYATELGIPFVPLPQDPAEAARILREASTSSEQGNVPAPVLRNWRQEFIDTVNASIE